MVKKILVLVLVFGMASITSAAVVISDNGDMTVDIKTDVELTTDDYLYMTLVCDTTLGTVSGGAIESSLVAGNGADWDLSIGNDAAGNYFPVPSGTNGVYMTELLYTGTFAVGTTLFENINISLTDGAATISLYRVPEDFSNYGTLEDSLVIPEPTTIALLSLGGLLMRRRRK